MLDFDVSFYWGRLVIAAIFSLVPFMWLKRHYSRLARFYFIGIVALIFVYSGVGAAWGSVPLAYLYKYIIYMIVLGITCKATIGKLNGTKQKAFDFKADALNYFISRYADSFIFLYISIPLLSLVFSGKILNLVSPPSLSLTDAIDGRFDGPQQVSFVESVLYYIQNLVMPFYFVCLYKYKDDIFKLTIALLLPFYFSYASTGYLSRSGTLPFLIMIYVSVYLTYPRFRKKLIRYTLIGIPFLFFGLSWYTFARAGVDFNISFGDALILLAQQETNYPMHYEEMQHWPFDGNLLYTYFQWLVTLPLPGFLKSSGLDYGFNAYFSEKMTGMLRMDTGFNILLPGLVGEGIFIFGKAFYWMHAIIVGWVISTAYKLVHHKQELFLVMYLSVYGGVSFARAGSVSMMPFYFKHLIIYIIVIYFVTHSRKYKRVNYNNSQH